MNHDVGLTVTVTVEWSEGRMTGRTIRISRTGASRRPVSISFCRRNNNRQTAFNAILARHPGCLPEISKCNRPT